MADLSNILAWRIPWRSLVDYSMWGRQDLDTIEPISVLGPLLPLSHCLKVGPSRPPLSLSFAY